MTSFQMRTLSFYFILSSFCSCQENWTITDIRGYTQFGYGFIGEYYNLGPTLKLVFDYDEASLPDEASINAECSAWVLRTPENCFNEDECFSIKASVPIWTSGKNTNIISVEDKSFTFLSIVDEIDCYECRLRIFNSWEESPADAEFGPWSKTSFVNISRCDRINPQPSLFICQASSEREQTFTVRKFDVQGSNGPKVFDDVIDIENQTNCYLIYEDSTGEIFARGKPSCTDLLAYWLYSFNADNTRLTKEDLLLVIQNQNFAPQGESIIARFDQPLEDIICYQPLSLVFVTQNISPTKKQWRLIRFETATNRSRTVIDIDATLVSTGCDRQIDHGKLALDWRPYWTMDRGREACVTFVSNGSLWSYDIGKDTCTMMSSFGSMGLDANALGEMSKFAIDWSYFYWINSTSNSIYTFSWDTNLIETLDIFQTPTGPVSLAEVVDLVPFCPSMTPAPSSTCWRPNLNFSVSMTSPTTGNLTITNVREPEDNCDDRDVGPIKITISIDCLSLNISGCNCSLSQDVFGFDRLQTHKATVYGLVKGDLYRIQGNSLARVDTSSLSKSFDHTFTANFEDRPQSRSVSWWVYCLGVFLTLVFLIVIVILARACLLQKRLRDFVNRQRIDSTQLTLIEKLGSGQFGEVWLSRFKDQNGQVTDVALKISKHRTKQNMSGNDFGNQLTTASCFLQEIVALNFLTHPNIIRALGVCSNYKDQNDKSAPALVLEYMNGGSAIDFVLAEKSHLSNLDLINIFLDVCSAGDHLCKMGVVHRDIGARNVLIRKNCPTGKSIIAKLTDFGLAKDVGKLTSMYKSSNRAVFHMRYTAPEGFRGLFSSQSDVWSFGIFVWEVYTMMGEIDSEVEGGPIPYSHLNTQEEILGELESGRRLEKPLMAPYEINSLMSMCWAKASGDRPRFNQLIDLLKSIQKSVIKNRSLQMPFAEETPYEPLVCDDQTAVRSVSNGVTVERLPSADYGIPIVVANDFASYASPNF